MPIRIVENWAKLGRPLTDLSKELEHLFRDLRDDLSVTVDNLTKTLESSQSNHFFALNESGQILGYTDLHRWHAATGPSGYIHLVVVKRAMQKQGIGTLLCTAAINKARALNLREIHLHTGAWRTGAQALYKSLGFLQKDTTVLIRALP